MPSRSGCPSGARLRVGVALAACRLDCGDPRIGGPQASTSAGTRKRVSVSVDRLGWNMVSPRAVSSILIEFPRRSAAVDLPVGFNKQEVRSLAASPLETADAQCASKEKRDRNGGQRQQNTHADLVTQLS